MLERLIETLACSGMEINLENENLVGTTPITAYDTSETTGECRIFNLFMQQDNKDPFRENIRLQFKEQTSEVHFGHSTVWC